MSTQPEWGIDMSVGDGDRDGRVLSLLLQLRPGPESDAEDAERLGRQLRAELSELDVDSIDSVAGQPLPEGAKGADPVTIGAVIVALSASGGVFTALIETLRDWLGRRSGGHRISVTIDGDTIELDNASVEQQRDVVDAFVRRHSAAKTA